MNKIPAEEILELLFLPISDPKVVEMLDALGIAQPAIDEAYEIDGRISIIDDENSGLQFEFEELDGSNADGMPIVSIIAFSQERKVAFPFGIHKTDDYETVCEKIGRKPDYCTKRRKESKQWLLPPQNGRETSMGVNFQKDFKGGVNNIVIREFKREVIENSLFIVPCEELEE